MQVPREFIYFLLPLIITIPAYILGRKLFFKDVPQSQMHLIKSGQLFTPAIGLLQMVLMIILWFYFEIP